jgi:hypothetical protein
VYELGRLADCGKLRISPGSADTKPEATAHVKMLVFKAIYQAHPPRTE